MLLVEIKPPYVLYFGRTPRCSISLIKVLVGDTGNLENWLAFKSSAGLNRKEAPLQMAEKETGEQNQTSFDTVLEI